MANCVIFGAGKIARGFIGHLLFLSGHSVVFIEKNNELCHIINQNKQYHVHVLGAPMKDCLIKNIRAVCIDDEKEVHEELMKADLIFTAIGGKNLSAIVPSLSAWVNASDKKVCHNIITCENWKKPAALLKNAVLAATGLLLDDIDNFGFAESVVMRSGIECDAQTLAKDPLAVNVQDFWELPVDEDALRGAIPQIDGVCLTPNFNGFLEKKFYTYNAANGTVSYLGHLKKYSYIFEAAQDQDILNILDGVYHETGSALAKKYEIPMEEMHAFALTSLHKLQDRAIVDFIERNARDPIRKLGYDDRLVGSARLCIEYGIIPNNLAIAIASAIHYDQPDDSFAIELQKLRESIGTGGILTKVCGIERGNLLFDLVLQKEKWLLSSNFFQRNDDV